MRHRKTITAAVAAVLIGGLAPPVKGYFQSYVFFSASEKYLEWFHLPLSQDFGIQRAQSRLRMPVSGMPAAVKYPYPDKKFEMTETIWRDSHKAVENGRSDWFDVEVVRQRAEVEEYPPAMNFLARMYEKGLGLQQNPRKAFMWYERAKLAGEESLSGQPTKIFQQLSPQEKHLAKLQLAEDIERMKTKSKSRYQAYDTVKLHVLEQQREYFLDNPPPEEKKSSPLFVVR